MSTENNQMRHYDYCGLRIYIFKSHEKGYCFSISDYDENNIPDCCLFNSEHQENYFDTMSEACEEAEFYIDNHF